MNLFNTLSRKIEKFEPLNPPEITFYTCGPTVYDYTHIGHMRTYINNDFLKRALTYLGYKVRHVMNITDVGHLTGDDDTGEDKLEKGAKKSGKTVWEVAEFYTDFFYKTLDALNITPSDKTIKATDCIDQMIQLINRLNAKGFVYETDETVYFDTSKFPSYGKLSGQKLEEKKQAVREEVHVDPKKRNRADFALWFKRVGRFATHQMHWDSPWGDGFPGWHIECSAIAMNTLGESIDIHAGGVDHIPVHHENEIAQSEAATGKQFVSYWFHNEFLLVDGKKMSKSLGNFYTIDDVRKQGIDPLALRLLFAQSHYHQQMNFTWESVHAAQEALNKLRETVRELKKQSGGSTDAVKEEHRDGDTTSVDAVAKYRNKFKEALSNDLQMPQAIAVVWEMLKSDISPAEKLSLLFDFDKVLGLGLSKTKEDKIPQEIIRLAEDREHARRTNNFAKSDELRKEIQQKGYTIEDAPEGFKIKKTYLFSK